MGFLLSMMKVKYLKYFSQYLRMGRGPEQWGF